MIGKGHALAVPAATTLALTVLAIDHEPLNSSGGTALGGDEVTIAFMVDRGDREIEAVILAQSIRDFGGGMAKNRISAMVPQKEGAISEATLERLGALDVRMEPFPVEEEAMAFPLAAKVFAAAAAESLARSQSGILAWLDSDNIVIREPKAFVLPREKALGYRPVMLRNISSMSDKPVDGFWKLVYEGCGTPPDRIFPMTTTVDGARIRAQFNAGLLVVRPEWGILRAWRDNFAKLYRREEFLPYYRQNPLHAVFVHQAVLAGTVLSLLVRSDLLELPEEYNYPLMLRENIGSEKRKMLEEKAVTLRYDEYRSDPEWMEIFERKGIYKDWMKRYFRTRETPK